MGCLSNPILLEQSIEMDTVDAATTRRFSDVASAFRDQPLHIVLFELGHPRRFGFSKWNSFGLVRTDDWIGLGRRRDVLGRLIIVGRASHQLYKGVVSLGTRGCAARRLRREGPGRRVLEAGRPGHPRRRVALRGGRHRGVVVRLRRELPVALPARLVRLRERRRLLPRDDVRRHPVRGDDGPHAPLPRRRPPRPLRPRPGPRPHLAAPMTTSVHGFVRIPSVLVHRRW